MIKKLVVLLGIAIAAVLIFAATKPNTFVVQRSASINAPPEKIYGFIHNFHKFALWSPYEKKDPTMQRTFSGADSGTGAVYEWNGDKNVGAGRMEITDTVQFSRITIKLDFIKPFEGHCTAEYTLVPKGDSTEVTWAMRGPNKFAGKVMSVFFNMDKMVGKDFESGLANLKTLAEN